MKTLKITLVAIFSIGLLTAVLPTSEINPTTEILEHEIKEIKAIETVFKERETKAKIPDNG